MRLENKAALITGGGSGIGLATALAFLREGARVAIAEISEERARAAVEHFRDAIKPAPGANQPMAARHEVPAILGDVSREADALRMVEETVSRFGRLDVLFNNAGILIEKPVHELSEEEWDRTMDVNLKGVFLVSKHALPHMIRQGRGSIINTGSVNSLVGDYGDPAYCASKGGVGMLTRAMALDYAKHGIRVNAVCPGGVETAMFRQEAATRGLSIEAYREQLRALHPIGRAGMPEEIAAAVVFLASDEASFVTGSLMVVDGGYTAV
jgi:dihydroanticapsin dehydrogenase